MWDLPRPGLEPVSPALAGGFLTTAPPGKPKVLFLTLVLNETFTLPVVLSESFITGLFKEVWDLGSFGFS